SARRSGAALRTYTIAGGVVRPAALEQFLAETEPEAVPLASPPELVRIPWRSGSMRLFISDLLFPGSPDPILSALAAGKSRGVILTPYCAAESAPAWSGNLELTDCETQAR